jgi:hypothetical protein
VQSHDASQDRAGRRTDFPALLCTCYCFQQYFDDVSRYVKLSKFSNTALFYSLTHMHGTLGSPKRSSHDLSQFSVRSGPSFALLAALFVPRVVSVRSAFVVVFCPFRFLSVPLCPHFSRPSVSRRLRTGTPSARASKEAWKEPAPVTGCTTGARQRLTSYPLGCSIVA